MNGLSAFNIVDAIVLVLLLFGIFGGVRRGLSGELARIIAIAFSVYAAWRLAQPAADLLGEHTRLSVHDAYVTAWIAVLVLAYLLLLAVRLVLRSLMVFAFKGKLERIGGAVCGLLRTAVVVAVVILFLSVAPQPNIQKAVSQDSYVGRFVCERVRPMYDDLSDRVPEIRLPTPEPGVFDEDTNTIEESSGDVTPAKDVTPAEDVTPVEPGAVDPDATVP